MEVITLSLSCIGFLVGYILATRSTEKKIIKYIESIQIVPKKDTEHSRYVANEVTSLKNYLLYKISHKEHRKA